MTNETLEFAPDDERLNQILAAYLDAQRDGRAVPKEELLRRHPDLVAELRSFFADQEHFHKLAEGLSVFAPQGVPEPLNPAGAETLPPLPQDRSAASSAANADPPLDMVRYFGDYELLAEIARGGMGVVYKARQVSLNRLVALKMILAGQLATTGDVERFHAEAQTAASLKHPNIVAIHEVGEHKGQHYFSMAFVEGASLAARVREHPLPPAEAAALVETVAQAIHYAHQKGVLHRDLKPANVILDISGRPHVTDFGLAKRIEGTTKLTATGSVLGTPAYMPPEQASADRGPISPASDVYALGAVLYELLTGRPPFQAPTPMDTLLHVLSSEPVPPRQLQPALPRNLETICLKCLHKESLRRYQTAAGLAEDLRRFRAGEPILARPVGPGERLWRWCRRNPAVASLTSAVALCLIAGTVVAVTLAVYARKQADAAEASAETAKQQTNLAKDNAFKASTETQRARLSEFKALQNLYISNMHQADLAWQVSQVERVRELLAAQKPTLAGVDFRGFEWYYLNRLCHSELRTLTGHHEAVRWAAVSPDGRTIASSGPSEIILWDAKTGKELRRFPGHQRPVFDPKTNSLVSIVDKDGGPEFVIPERYTEERRVAYKGVLALSGDGKRLATLGKEDRQVIVWDWSARKQLKTFQGHDATISCLAFSPDGRFLAVGGRWDASGLGQLIFGTLARGISIRIWDLESGKEFFALAHPGGVSAIAFSPDGKYLTSGGGDLKISRDGKWRTSGGGDGTVKVWNLQSRKELHSFSSNSSLVVCVAYSRDGKCLASAGYDDQIVHLWDPLGGKALRSFKGHTRGVNSVAFSPDGKWLVSGSVDKTVKLWNVERDQEAFTFSLPEEPLNSAAFHPDGKRMAYLGNGVTLWDVTTGKMVRSINSGIINLVPEAAALSPDGKLLATLTASLDFRLDKEPKCILRIQDLDSGKSRDAGSFSSWLDMSVLFNPSGRRLAIAEGNVITIVKAGDAKEECTLRGQQDNFGSKSFSCMTFSPNGQYLAACYTSWIEGRESSQVMLWNAEEGREIHRLDAGAGYLLALTFSPDGKHLLAAGRAESWSWDVASGKKLVKFRLPPSTLASFHPDGKRLATTGPDKRIALWDTATGQQVLSLKNFGRVLRWLTFTPDGTRLVAGGADDNNETYIRVWDATPLK
jgi:WD40 repeat protein/serine/threonine protein kinase